jgi:hypothetical protein
MTQSLKQKYTKINTNDIIINHDIFGFGEYSWVNTGYYKGQPTISVQWLQWQGEEFRIIFNTTSERDSALKSLLYSFKPKFKHNKNDVYLYGKTYDFSIEKTINPLSLFKILKKDFGAMELHLTPTSATVREFMYSENWNLIQNEHSTPIIDRNKKFIGDFLIVDDLNIKLLSKAL